jgi:hypothetical protein
MKKLCPESKPWNHPHPIKNPIEWAVQYARWRFKYFIANPGTTYEEIEYEVQSGRIRVGDMQPKNGKMLGSERKEEPMRNP